MPTIHIFLQVVTATVNLDDVRTYRMNMQSRCMQAAASPAYPRVLAEVHLTDHNKA